MHFYPKALLKFHSTLSIEELATKIKTIPEPDSIKKFLFGRLKPENRFDIILTEKGFDLWEKNPFFLTERKFHKISTANWYKLENGTEFILEIKLPIWLLIGPFIASIVIFIGLYQIAGFASLLFPVFIYFGTMLNFTLIVDKIEYSVIHKICDKKVKKIQL